MWTWLCLQCTQTRKIYLLLWKNCKRMFEGSWILKVNTPYFELIQQRTVFSKWLLLSNESKIPCCLRAHRGSSNFTMSTSSIADSRSCDIAWPYLMMKLPYERLTNPLQQTFKKSFGHWKSSEFPSSWPLTLPPVFFWQNDTPSSDNTGELPHGVGKWWYFLKVFSIWSLQPKRWKLLVETSSFPKDLSGDFFLLAQFGRDPWIPMVLRRQPFLSKKVDRCKWVETTITNRKPWFQHLAQKSFTNSIGFFCWIFESLQPFIIPPIFLEDQPPTDHGPNLNPRSFPRHLATCAASTSSATAQPAAFDAALLRMDLPASTKARVQWFQ